jgi:3-oxoacyl-[acyl-carrier protein] reductase
LELGLAGRVAIVAAASRGLGRASAEALAADGANLVISARGADRLHEVAAELRARGAQVLAIPADVTDPAVPAALVAAALERFGRLDIVVPNSGGPPPGRALEVDDDALRAAVEANLLTHVRFVRSSLPHLADQGWGRICCIASFGVVQPIDGLALSNAARTGLRAWAKTAAFDLQGSGVTLNLVCPGLHRTDRILALGTPSGPLGAPADFGRVVAFLCSEPAGFVNGATVVVDGGATLAL